MSANDFQEKFLKLEAVNDIVAVPVPTIYEKMREGKFPRPIKVGRSSYWKLSDINNWMNEHIEANKKEQEQLKKRHQGTLK